MQILNRLRQDKALLVCVMLVGYALSVSASAVLTSNFVIGADYYFHLDVATFYAKGNFEGGMNYILTNIFFPYPPVFHLMLVPSVWSGAPQLFGRLAEIFFMPTTFALTLWFVVKYANSKAAAFTGLVLLGCWSFMDGALQVRPESLDLLFYPIIVGALLSGRKKLFTCLSIINVYSHGPAAISNIYGLALDKIREPKWRRTILLTLLISLPIIIISLFYIQGAFAKWGGYSPTENPQEAEFWNTPLSFVPAYMGSTLIGLVYIGRNLFVVRKKIKANLSNLESLLTWGFMGSLIMLPMWADRWMHYVSIPLAILAGLGLSRMQGKKQLVVGFAVISVFMIYYAMWIMMSANGVWWQPGD